VTRFLDEADKHSAEFGLDKPNGVITIHFRDGGGKEPLIISISKFTKQVPQPSPESKAPDGKADRKNPQPKTEDVDFAYFTASNRPSVYQTNPAVVASTKFAFEGLRERKLFAFDSSRVKSVNFQPAEGSGINMSKGADGRWSINGKPGDDIFVEQAISNLAGLEADAFPKVEHSYGFEKPRLRVVVELKEAGTDPATTMTLTIGNAFKSEDRTKTAYYAVADDLANPFMISEQTFKNIFFHEEALVKTESDGAVAPAGKSPDSSSGTTPQ
jgi:hypothetical protein